MPVVTVATLLQRIRDATDSNDDGEDGFVTDAAMLRWLNAARPRFEAMIARAGWTHTPANFPITANGSTAYDLGVQVMAVMGVFEVRDGRYRPLRLAHSMTTPTEVTGVAREYTMLENTTTGATRIGLRPVPTSGTYYVLYLAQPATLTAADSVNYPMGWEEWLVLEVARQVAGREESVNVTNEDRKREIEKEVERAASDRAFAQGARVRNVDAAERDHWAVSASLSTPEEWVWP